MPGVLIDVWRFWLYRSSNHIPSIDHWTFTKPSINRSSFTKPSINRLSFTKPSINRWQFGERYDVIIDFDRLLKGSALEINELSVLYPYKSKSSRLRRAKKQSIAILITITSIDCDSDYHHINRLRFGLTSHQSITIMISSNIDDDYDTITSIDAKPMTSKHIEDREKLWLPTLVRVPMCDGSCALRRCA